VAVARKVRGREAEQLQVEERAERCTKEERTRCRRMCFEKGELFVKKVGFEVKVVLESSIEHT